MADEKYPDIMKNSAPPDLNPQMFMAAYAGPDFMNNGIGVAVGMGMAMDMAKKQQESANAKKCAKCGEVLKDGWKFCQNCGEPVPAVLFCAACGKQLEPGAKFCTECGAKTEK